MRSAYGGFLCSYFLTVVRGAGVEVVSAGTLGSFFISKLPVQIALDVRTTAVIKRKIGILHRVCRFTAFEYLVVFAFVVGMVSDVLISVLPFNRFSSILSFLDS